MTANKGKGGGKVWAVGAALVVVCLVAMWWRGWFGWMGWGAANWFPDTVSGTVREKYIKDNAYRVAVRLDSETIEVMTCQDVHNLFAWNTDSGDDFANLEPGVHYRLRVLGYRNPLWSQHRTIISFQRDLRQSR